MTVGAHIIVQGLVQGVGFRFYVLRHATQLNVTGFVRNLMNDDVEVEVEGERGLIESLIKELKVGPRAGYVTNLHIEWKEYKNLYRGFEIR